MAAAVVLPGACQGFVTLCHPATIYWAWDADPKPLTLPSTLPDTRTCHPPTTLREVARLKEESWRSKEDHVESLWARAVERNDRSWVMLACFLLAVAVGLLTVVAYRLDHVSGTAACAHSCCCCVITCWRIWGMGVCPSALPCLGPGQEAWQKNEVLTNPNAPPWVACVRRWVRSCQRAWVLP